MTGRRRTVRTGLFCIVCLIPKHVPPRDISCCLETPNNFSLFLFASFCEDKFNSNNTNKRQKLAQDFLNSIDQTGELLAMFEDDEIDDVKQERMEVILFFIDTQLQQRKLWNISHIMLVWCLFHAASYIVITFIFLLPRWSNGILFPYISYPSNVSRYLSTHAEKKDYKRVVMDLSVCHVFVFPSCRNQILFINISHAFFAIFFFFLIIPRITELFQ